MARAAARPPGCVGSAVVDFEFDADQQMLRESVRRFLAVKAPIAYVRATYEHDAPTLGHDDVWVATCRELAERVP